MNLRFKTDLPWFELSILLILLAIGWAAWEFNRISARPSRTQEGDEKKLDSERAAFQGRMEKEFGLTWERYILSNSNALQSLRDAKDPHKLPGAYRLVAERLQTELPRIHPNLVRYSSRTNWRDMVQWEKRNQDLKDWLWALQLQSEQEGLVAQSQELVAKGTNLLSMDLGTLFRDAERRLTNYVAKGEYISTLARYVQTNSPADAPPIASSQPAVIRSQNPPTNLRDELAEAQIQIQGLLELAGRARLEAAKLDSRPLILPDPLEKVKGEFAQLGTDALRAAMLSEVNAYLARLQPVFYALLAAAFGLSLFLITAIYRRVLEKLRFRLYQSVTENKLAHVGQFVGWLSHEIRHSLTAINAWQWTIQKAATEGSLEHQGTIVIRKEINRVDRVLKDACRLTQPGTPRLVLVQAEPVLREVLELLGPQLEPRGIRFTFDCPIAACFAADPQQFKQVLINLVNNAAESIENEGTITLRARKDKAQLEGRPSEVVVIEVEDTGSGIAPEVQQRLFDPFFSTKQEGMGLGLPIVAKIIEAHKGALEFKTAVGEGTTFRIVLPACDEGKRNG